MLTFIHQHGLSNLHVRTAILCLFRFRVTIGLPFRSINILRIFACGRLYLVTVLSFKCDIQLQEQENIHITVTCLFVLTATDKGVPHLMRVKILSYIPNLFKILLYIPNPFFNSVVLKLCVFNSSISNTRELARKEDSYMHSRFTELETLR